MPTTAENATGEVDGKGEGEGGSSNDIRTDMEVLEVGMEFMAEGGEVEAEGYGS